MQRRQFIAAVGAAPAAGLTGCLGSLDAVGGSGGERTYPALSVAADPAPGSATVDVRVVREFDADGPARLEVAVTNGGSDDLEATFGAIPPFSDLHGERADGDEVALLIPVEDPHKRAVIPESSSNGTWRATGDVAVNATATMVRITPGETLSETYALLGAPTGDGLSAGDYRFGADDYLGTGPWGFAVSVSY